MVEQLDETGGDGRAVKLDKREHGRNGVARNSREVGKMGGRKRVPRILMSPGK